MIQPLQWHFVWLVVVGISTQVASALQQAVPRILNPLTNRRIQLGGPTYQRMMEEGQWIQYNGTLHRLNLELLKTNDESIGTFGGGGGGHSINHNNWSPSPTMDEWFSIRPTYPTGEPLPLEVEEQVQKDLLFVHKPSGLHCVPPRDITQPSLATLIQSTAYYPAAKPCHRLDYDTSGIVVFGLNQESHSKISKQFEDRTTSKTYLALVDGHPTHDSGIIDIKIGKRKTPEGFHRWATAITAPPDSSAATASEAVIIKPREAITEWKVLERRTLPKSGAQFSLVELSPKTGRGHQLRLHMKAIGHAILGDTLHAPTPDIAKCSPRLCLQAHQLQVEWNDIRIQAQSIVTF